MKALSTRAWPRGQVAPEEQVREPVLSEHELALAHQIQPPMLPGILPELPGFEIEAFCQSAGPVGGDFYDVVPLASGSVLFVIADVMGKGTSAAIVAAALRARLRALAKVTESPGDLLARTNRLMFEELSRADIFATVQAGVLDPSRRTLTVANAGHCPLLLRKNSSETDLLAPEGMPLGIVPDTVFIESEVQLKPGASLMFYTDGLTDTRNADGEFFGQERLQKWFLKHGVPGVPARKVKEQLDEEIVTFENSRTRRAFVRMQQRGAVSDADDRTFILVASSNRPIAQASALNTSAVPLQFPSLEAATLLPTPSLTASNEVIQIENPSEQNDLTQTLSRADLPAA